LYFDQVIFRFFNFFDKRVRKKHINISIKIGKHDCGRQVNPKILMLEKIQKRFSQFKTLYSYIQILELYS
jgi:hypothetical protein